MKTEGEKISEEITTDGCAKRKTWRRRLVWLAFALLLTTVLCTPWNASVGSYGTLVAIPELETVVRASDAATLIELRSFRRSRIWRAQTPTTSGYSASFACERRRQRAPSFSLIGDGTSSTKSTPRRKR